MTEIQTAAEMRAACAKYLDSERGLVDTAEASDPMDRILKNLVRDVLRRCAKDVRALSVAEDPRDEVVRALKEVMDWIDNWDPNFIDDDEWPETKARVDAALARLPAGEEGNRE